MAGLNDFISDVNVKTTELPQWYDTAQQNMLTQAGNIAGAAPAANQTVGQQAVNTLTGANNPFLQAQTDIQGAQGMIDQQNTALGQAQGVLGNLANQAANPFAEGSTLKGLFDSQGNLLNQILPEIDARVDAGAIGTGNFGSLRNLTARDKARADAFANLTPAQFQAALQSQGQGIQAGQGLATAAGVGGNLATASGNLATAGSNIGEQGINTAMNVGNWQQNADFTPLANYAKILGQVQAPTTVSSQQQLSPLNQIAGLIAALGGGDAKTGILDKLGVGGLEDIMGVIGSAGTGLWDSLFGGSTDTGTAGGSTGDTSWGDVWGDDNP